MLNEQLILKMTEFNQGDAKRIQHFIRGGLSCKCI